MQMAFGVKIVIAHTSVVVFLINKTTFTDIQFYTVWVKAGRRFGLFDCKLVRVLGNGNVDAPLKFAVDHGNDLRCTKAFAGDDSVLVDGCHIGVGAAPENRFDWFIAACRFGAQFNSSRYGRPGV